MAYRLQLMENTLEGNTSFTSETGSHECVALVQGAAGAPNTRVWQKGIKVLDAKIGSIPLGTAIATFDGSGRYPQSARHAAIYVTHDSHGIVVYDQWASQGKVSKRKIRKRGGINRSVNDASFYYVIE